MSTAPTLTPALPRLMARWKNDRVAFVREAYAMDPEGLPVHIDGPQERILRAVDEHDRVVVRSAHGIGKTTAGVWLMHHWLSTRHPALVVTLAGNWSFLSSRYWPEAHTWTRNWALREAFELQEMGLYSFDNPGGWRAEAVSSNRPDFIEGFHSPNLLVLIDEAKAMPDELYAAIRGALTQLSASGARPKVVVLSTPPLVDAGWYCALFGTKSSGWERIHISAEDSKRVSREYIEEMAKDFGTDSAVYQAKVLGLIPEGASEAVVQKQWIEAAQRRGPVVDGRPVVLTVDVARQGEDLTVWGKLHKQKHSILEWKAKNTLTEVIGASVRLAKRENARYIVVDDTGVGGGVTDGLRELQAQGGFPKTCAVIPEIFGESPSDRHSERFSNRKAELWWAARRGVRDSLALMTDPEMAKLQLPRGSNLIEQLSAPIYEEDSRSRIRVLDHRGNDDKREKVKALPRKSPDLAHTLILGADLYLRLKGEPLEETLTREQEAQKLMAQRRKDLWEKMNAWKKEKDPKPNARMRMMR